LNAQPASATVTDRPARRRDPDTIDLELEAHRRELTGHCRRMLGSNSEAEDAVQETMVRAWRHIDGFGGRSTLRTWLYSIATNVCIDMRRGPQRRAQPMDLGPSSTADRVPSPHGSSPTWARPLHDPHVAPDGGDPAELATSREMTRLALVAALRLLPPRQRAVLILREVLSWQAREVAELLDTSQASVNSALQRARATLDRVAHDAVPPRTLDEHQRELLTCFLDAFQRDDVASIVALAAFGRTRCTRGRHPSNGTGSGYWSTSMSWSR
jgi:RNA polymerase sigma-70 factor, ECF subfamily